MHVDNRPGAAVEMKIGIKLVLALAALLVAAPLLFAQTKPASGSSSSDQNKPAASQPQPSGNPFPGEGSTAPVLPSSQTPPAPQRHAVTPPPSASNPFPDESNVPVLPNNSTINLPQGTYHGSESPSAALPPDDLDPVRSPDSPDTAAGSQSGFSSSQTGLDQLEPVPGANPSGNGGKDSQQIAAMPQETPANDISVGNYYLDNKNWHAALSRFQSAMILDPNNPDVYWGLAESERHLGDFADARQHYLKVMEYDPDSRHAKDARKALRDPDIENARNPAPPAAGPSQ